MGVSEEVGSSSDFIHDPRSSVSWVAEDRPDATPLFRSLHRSAFATNGKLMVERDV